MLSQSSRSAHLGVLERLLFDSEAPNFAQQNATNPPHLLARYHLTLEVEADLSKFFVQWRLAGLDHVQVAALARDSLA